MNKSGKLKMYNNERSEERKMRSLENLEIKSHLSTPISHISGITLVALVVTIVVLLILAGVTITALLGDDGIIKKAQNAADLMNNAIQSEQNDMNALLNELDEIIIGNSGGGTTPGDNEENPGGDDNPPEVTTLPADGSFNETKGVNTPNLGTNMSLVKFDEGTQDWVVDETNSAYSYIDTSTSGNTNKSEWANAKVTVDGIDSYFVWIPRYAYKIIGENNIDIKFLKGTSNIAADGVTVCKYANENPTASDYIIHPAFTNDANYGGGFGNNNGNSDNGIAGIWIGKYETARSDTQGATQGSATTLKVQPGVTSYRSVTIGDAYTYAKAYNPNLKSHMLKNSEWGAVAYLTESKYGRNGTEVTINNNGTTYYTGGGEEKAYIENTEQSSTGNVYGIYDLSGNAYEYVASYYTGGSSTYLNNGSSFTSTKTSDEYSTAYTGTSASSAYKYGDATHETSGWHTDRASFVLSTNPFFARGGYYGDGDIVGVFSYYCPNGNAYSSYSFRLALVV